MNIFSINNIILFASWVIDIVLALVVLRKNSKSLLNRSFFFMILSIVVWGFTNLISNITSSATQALIWSKLTFIGPFWLPAFLLIFTLVFTKTKRRVGRVAILLIIAVPLFLTATSPLRLVVDDITDVQPAQLTYGPLYPLFGVFLVGSILVTIFLLIRSWIKSDSVVRSRVKYLFFGLLISFVLGLSFNLVFPVILNNSSLTDLGPASTIFFIGFTAYAIIRHQLLEIRFIVLRTVTYSLVVVTVSAAVVGLTVFLSDSITASTSSKAFIAVLASVFIVLILDPLKRGIAKATDAVFFKARVDYQNLLTEISEIINREIDLDILLYSLSKKLEKTLKIKNVAIYLAGSTGGAFYKRIGRVDKQGHKLSDEEFAKLAEDQKTDIEHRIHHDNPLVTYLRHHQDVIVLEALERKIEDTQDDDARKKLESSKAALDSLDAAVVAPVTVGNNLNAVMVVGPKLSGDPFGSEDLNLLNLIGPQLASALEKSRLYEEAQQFTERLKKEVAVATNDLRNANMQLQERNRFLQALQKVTTLISRTLDFGKVTQSVVDSIATELGYMGGVLLLLGKDRHKLFPEAVTRTPITEKGLKLLPKPLNEYYGYYPDDQSLSVEAIKTGKVQIGEKLSQFISPAVPPPIAATIQKIVGIQTIVAVPVYSEDEIVGVIDFMLRQDHGALKATDLDAMKALAGQTGIVYRNIQLYKQLEESNKDLEVANVHLQQLDQAKSEFVSIASHQLRTPMTGIMGYLSMIVGGDFGKVPADLKKILTGLLDESQRMIRLINLFLNVSKIESGKMTLNRQEMPMDELVAKVVDMAHKTATDKGLKLEFKKPKQKLPTVFADTDKLGDVIMNLVDNAIKYTDEGGITVESKVNASNIETTVKDTGRGIDPEEAKKLFTKFVRGFGIAQVNPDGSGLGLYVARRLTEAHDGKIWVESEGKGKGATFHVQIPIYKEGMKEAEAKVGAHEAPLITAEE